MTTILKTSALKDIEIKRVQGQSILDFYPQIMRIMKNANCSDLLLNMFAEPNVNRDAGRVVWKSSASSPNTFSSIRDCTEGERQHALSLLKIAYTECVSLADAYGKSVGADAAGPTALKSMLSTPDLSSSVFFNGDNVVVTEWGCIPVGAIPRDFDLIVQSNKQSKFEVKETTIHEAEEASNSPELVSSNETIIKNTPVFFETPSVQSPSPSEYTAPTNTFIIWRLPLIIMLFFLLILLLIFCLCSKNTTQTNIPQQLPQPQLQTDQHYPIPRQNRPPSSSEIQNRLKDQSVAEGNLANVSLAWSGFADLDLIVIEPNGSRIDFNNRKSSFSDGSIDIDANRCTEMQGCIVNKYPIENISWQKNMPSGVYKIYIGLYSANIDPQKLVDITYTVLVTYRGKRVEYPGVIKTSDIICDKTCHSRGLIPIGEINVVQ